MAWRKWLVRSLVFSIMGATVLAAVLYEAWTNPSAVRHQVLVKLGVQFSGASVHVESARLRLLGGIMVRDLRMARRDDLDRGDFLYAPSAIIYYDKEHLLDGKLHINKVELDRPRLRIVRERDGRINLSGVLAPPDLNERVPTIIIRQGTILVEDRSLSSDSALLEIKDVNLTIINDPLLILTLEGAGQTDVVGGVHLHGRFHRATTAASAAVELPDVPVGPDLVQRIAGFCPDVAAHLRRLQGSGAVQATFLHRPDAVEPWTYDVRCQLTRGEWGHACLPEPLQQIEASLRCVNGRVPEAQLLARSGAATIDVKLWDLAWTGHRPKCIEEAVRKLDVHVKHLVVTDNLFEHLPQACKNIQRLYSPRGPVTLKYNYERTRSDQWHKHCDIQPEGMSAEFEQFRYPVEALTGSVEVDLRSDYEDWINVDLTGRGGGRAITVKGSLRGENASEVDLVVAADDVPLDHKLMLALPERSRELARTFLPTASRELGLVSHPRGLVQPAGLANIKVYIRRVRGQKEFANRYVLAFHHTSLKYDLFPYPLENVSGVLDIQPDHWECQNFHGTHNGGEIWVSGCSFWVRDTSPAAKQEEDDEDAATESRPTLREAVQVAIRGQGIPLDREFDQALSPPEAPGRTALRNAWAMLALQGRLNFEAVVVDRPDQPQDIDVAVDVRGCSMKPDFFRYSMSDVSAGVRYAHGRVYVKDVSAKHESCRLGLKEATIELKSAGGFRAWIKGIRGTGIIPDEEFLRALHPAMRKTLELLRIGNPLDVETSLVLDAAAAPGRSHEDLVGRRRVPAQSGLPGRRGDSRRRWRDLVPRPSQWQGLRGGQRLRRTGKGHHPQSTLPQSPGTHRNSPRHARRDALYDLKADLFGGFLGGEARFHFNSTLRYDVKLDALHVQLDQFGKHNHVGADGRMQGPARASLHLTGEGTDLSGLKGNGRIDVDNGKLYRLPFLLGLLKAFGLRWPDRTAFEQARRDLRHRGAANAHPRPGPARQRHQPARPGHAEPGRQQSQSRFQRRLGAHVADAVAGHQRSVAGAQRSALQDQGARQNRRRRASRRSWFLASSIPSRRHWEVRRRTAGVSRLVGLYQPADAGRSPGRAKVLHRVEPIPGRRAIGFRRDARNGG